MEREREREMKRKGIEFVILQENIRKYFLNKKDERSGTRKKKKILKNI